MTPPWLFARNIYAQNADKTNPSAPMNMGHKAWMVFGVDCALWALALVIVCMRMYSRRVLTNFHGPDDYIMIGAMVFSTGDFALKVIWCLSGLGKHVEDVSPFQLARFAKVGYSVSVLYPWSLGLVKISILAFYRRTFPSDKFRKVCAVSMVFIGCMTFSVSMAQLFACVPISDSYSLKQGQKARCVNKPALQYSGSVLNVATDVAILLLPMKYLWALTLDKYRRFGVIALFSLGLIACVASAFRLSTIYKFYNSSDPSYTAYPIAIWSGVEINLTIITACIAASKPFLDRYLFKYIKKYFPSLWPGTLGSKRRSNEDRASSELSAIDYTYASHATHPLPSYISRPGTERRTTLTSDVVMEDATSEDSVELDFHSMLRPSLGSRKNSRYSAMQQDFGGGGKMSLKDILGDSRIPEPSIAEASILEDQSAESGTHKDNRCHPKPEERDRANARAQRLTTEKQEGSSDVLTREISGSGSSHK